MCVCTAVREDGTSVSVSCQDDSSLDRQLFVTCVCVFVCTAVCDDGTSVSISCQDDSSLDRQLFVTYVCVCVSVCLCVQLYAKMAHL